MQTTIRLRLTLLYGGLFVVAGAVLLTLNYAMVKRNLPVEDVMFTSPAPGELFVDPALGPGPFDVPFAGEAGVLIDGRHVPVEELRDLPGRVRDGALHQLLVQSATALGLMAVASVGLGWVVAGRVLRPCTTSRPRPSACPSRTSPSASASPARPMTSRNWPTRSTPCSVASTPPSTVNAASWPTPRTSCGHRSRSCAPRSTSLWPTPTPGPTRCARWPAP